MMYVSNLISSKGNKVANQFKIVNGDVVAFQSYESRIITVDKANNTIFIHSDYGYSRTTAKYTKIFLQDVFYVDFANEIIKAVKNNETKIDMWNIVYC